MKKLLLSLFIILTVNTLSAQPEVDALLEKLAKVENREHAETLLDLARYYASKDSSRCVYYSNQLIDEADKLNYADLLTSGYYQIGETNYYFDSYSRATFFYEKAMDGFRNLNDSSNIAECFNSIGLVYYYTGEYNISIDYLIKALRVFEETGIRDQQAHVYSNIGMVYSRVKDYEMAVENYRRAAEINEAIRDSASLSVNYNGLGVAYYNLEETDSSKVYYNKALQVFTAINNRQRQAIVLNNIANIYVSSGDSLELALDYYSKALDVFRELKDVRNEAAVLEGLGSVYRELGNPQQALAVYQNCLDLANKHQLGYFLKKAVYNDIAIAYEKLGRISDAYRAYKLYSQYNDSLLLEERMDQVAELSKKYETEKKEAEIDRLSALQQVNKLQFQREKQFRIFGIVIILLLLIFTFILAIGYLDKRRTNLLLSVKNTQIEQQRLELEKINASKNKFFSIIAHDLKNPFHTVMGYSYLMHKEYKRFKDEERQKYAEDIYKSTHNIFRLLQNLLDWSRSQTGRLIYEPRLFDFADLYKNISGLLKPVAESKRIDLIDEIQDDLVAYADPMMVETITRNLINNAIKFSSENGWVKIGAVAKESHLLISVEDNGIGIKSEDITKLFRIDSKVKRKGTNNEDGSGLGLILCKEFVEKNGGEIGVESTPGTGSKFWFTLPIPEAKAS